MFISCVLSKFGIFSIFVKNFNIKFEFNHDWGHKFSFQRFLLHTQKKLVILSVHWHTDHQHIPNLTMVNVGLISPGNYEMGFSFSGHKLKVTDQSNFVWKIIVIFLSNLWKRWLYFWIKDILAITNSYSSEL